MSCASQLWVFVALALPACAAQVSPSTDATVRDVVNAEPIDTGHIEDAPSRDALADRIVRDQDDVFVDVEGGVVADAGADTDADLGDSAVPRFFDEIFTEAVDADPAHSRGAFQPYWFVLAVLNTEVRSRRTFVIPGGSCDSVTFVRDRRLPLGTGVAIVGARMEPFREWQPNWFRTRLIEELLPVEQEVRVRFSGAGPIEPFEVSATLPPPTTVTEPVRPVPPMSQALIASVARPLVIRYQPVAERVQVSLTAWLPGGLELSTRCEFDGRSGEATIPSEVLRQYPNESPPNPTTLVAIDTVRSSPVLIGGQRATFQMRSASAQFSFWLTP
jgi:hypothetical protein